MSNNLPVVLVHGMLGFGPDELGQLDYWRGALQAPCPLPRLQASVGPISSPHDRACELAAQIKGTRVDYGEEHAAAEGHARYGRDYAGRALWPEWDGGHALHMVGHSLGATTLRALQTLLARDFWGWGSSANWIASLSSIAGPLNGTTAVYYFGADPQTGLLLRRSGLAPILSLLKLYTAYRGRSLDAIYDFDLDQWGFTRAADEELISYLRRAGQSRFFWGPDNALYSISLQGAYRDNARWPTYPGTYYFAYVAKNSRQIRRGGYHYPSPLMNPRLQPTSWYIGRHRFAEAPIPDRAFSEKAWWENDGLVPTYSQQFPHSNGRHQVGGSVTASTKGEELLRGLWYTQWERGIDHGAILNASRFWQKAREKRFYRALFYRLAALDLNRPDRPGRS